MKKIHCFLSALCILIAITSCNYSGSYEYNLGAYNVIPSEDKTGVILAGYIGTEINTDTFTIPDQILGLPVIEIKSGEKGNYSNIKAKQIIIPDSIKIIRTGAFTSCTSLTSLVMKSEVPPVLESNAFNVIRLYVPSAALTQYKNAAVWAVYKNIIVASGSELVEENIFSSVLVEGGNFKRGNDTITVSSFYMSKYEVTQKEWKSVIGNKPSNFESDYLPVEKISWYEAIEYCNRLSEREGLAVVYSSSGDTTRMNITANGYRLPTEAEWEYAARGGKYQEGFEYSGGNYLAALGWCVSNSSSKPQSVGIKQPNALGLYDMSGNVWEWCWDWYGNYEAGNQTNPQGSSTGSYRVFRGGGWSSAATDCTVSYRNRNSPNFRNNLVGFRPVRSL